MSQMDSLKSYKETLNLPQTDFPIRAKPKELDPEMINRWENENLFYKSFIHNRGNPKYILHYGPPYANGNIHLGHAYSEILKDILCKSRRMSGYHVPLTPGWDCHGLPIELKVTQEKPGLNRTELIKACRNYAQHWIDIQKTQFKNLGILANWNEPYITMSPNYESDTVRAFGTLVKEGFIERKNKTVPWCFSCETVLASAEIEYKERKDPSIYVLFELGKEAQKRLFSDVEKPINFLVWTTTPWTIPLNRGIMLKKGGDYQLVDIKGTLLIVGAKVADQIARLVDADKKVLKDFKADYLADTKAQHPLGDHTIPVIFDESVGIEEGTACVHTAPGCGPIDYEIGIKNKLEIYSPLSPSGTYTCGIQPKELENMAITKGQIWVIKKLAELNKLFFKNNIKHSYPHCWRCRTGLMFRATPQWFFDLDKHNIKQKALKATESIEFTPDRGRNFMRATLENRWEWCLSRQRTWGAPIPALLCTSCDYTYITEEFVNLVAQGIQKEGIEYWNKVSIQELLQKLSEDVACPHCKTEDLKTQEFKKEQDILDVWFDSGISHYAVLYNNPELKFPADMYLEGVDQYRGWFQSSLLTSLVLEEEPAMKAIMSHGFTVDEKGQKMSKSLGNVVSPEDLTAKIGTDGLRLWVSSNSPESDIVVSPALLQNVGEVYRKIRNTCRFLLSNLYDFDIDKDAIDLKELLPIDRYALLKLNVFNESLIKDYENNDFTGIFHGLADYCTVELSSFYLDIIKDRLYVDKKDGLPRRSAQTVVWYILDVLVKLMAPILSITAEQLSDYYQKDKKESIHLQPFADTAQFIKNICSIKKPLWPSILRTKNGDSNYLESDLRECQQEAYNFALWDLLKEIRDAVLKAIEIQREKGDIKHSLEVNVKLYIDTNLEKFRILKDFFESFKHEHQSLEDFFKAFFIVSQFELYNTQDNLLESSLKGVHIDVEKAAGVKCPRCWHWSTTDHLDNLCIRCQRVISN